MNDQEKRNYRARMAVAQIFRQILKQDGERARLMKSLDVETMPVIIPALGDTLVSNVREAAKRYLDAGEHKVVVPVCLFGKTSDVLTLSILSISDQDSKSFWSLNMSDLHNHTNMEQVVETLDPDKKWDIEELNPWQRQELKDLATFV